jgi:hypothetical protein
MEDVVVKGEGERDLVMDVMKEGRKVRFYEDKEPRWAKQ